MFEMYMNDQARYQLIESTLCEWLSDEDEIAYGGL